MKKLIFILLLVFLSCEKESLHCYKCETVVNDEIISTITTCGMPESDVMDFQQGLEAQAEFLLKCPAETKCLIK